mmetsp:Transcript_54132/g.171766  ORF Transcript_54132/g.171766 Transcript_54132/m.171766 type:complete len:290 (+) Transcript_54132:422-1291(+)
MAGLASVGALTSIPYPPAKPKTRNPNTPLLPLGGVDLLLDVCGGLDFEPVPPNLPRQRLSPFGHLADRHAAEPTALEHLGPEQPDDPRPHDEDAARGGDHPQPLHPPQDAADGFRERGHAGGDAGRQGVEVLGGHHHVVRPPPVPEDADGAAEAASGTEVHPPVMALHASPARAVGVHSHHRPNGEGLPRGSPRLNDPPADLVPEHHVAGVRCKLPLEDVEVGAADSDIRDLDEDLVVLLNLGNGMLWQEDQLATPLLLQRAHRGAARHSRKSSLLPCPICTACGVAAP